MPTVQSWSADIDYVTITATDAAGSEEIERVGWLLVGQLRRNGDRLKAGGTQGYQGWRCGKLFFGQRQDGAMMDIKGSAAGNACRLVDWSKVRATRLDCQVTVLFHQDAPRVASALSQWVEDERERTGDYPMPSPHFHGGHGAGDGFTIGKRGSPRYARIYNKGRQSKERADDRSWRYEVEYRRVVARNAVELLSKTDWSAAAIAGVVGGQFSEYRISIPVDHHATLVAGSIGRRDHDTERVIKWLREQVAPAIDRLLGTVDMPTVLEALGITFDEKREEAYTYERG